MTIVYSCLCFASISRGLMTKPAGFLRVPPLKLGEQIVWFFSFLISLLFVPLFQYIFVYGFIYYSLIVIMGIFLVRAFCDFDRTRKISENITIWTVYARTSFYVFFQSKQEWIFEWCFDNLHLLFLCFGGLALVYFVLLWIWCMMSLFYHDVTFLHL